jgi:hypothetical protein
MNPEPENDVPFLMPESQLESKELEIPYHKEAEVIIEKLEKERPETSSEDEQESKEINYKIL